MKMLKSFVALGLVLGILTGALADTPKHIGRAATVNGILISVNGGDLVVRVKQPNGESKELTLPTDDNTEVRVDGDVGTLHDLRPDMAVQITSAVKNVPGPARLVRATSKSLNGVVIRVEGRNLILRGQEQGQKKEVTVETDSTTRVFFGASGPQQATASEGRLEDIKAEMRVKVLPDTGTARKIFVTSVPAKKTAK